MATMQEGLELGYQAILASAPIALAFCNGNWSEASVTKDEVAQSEANLSFEYDRIPLSIAAEAYNDSVNQYEVLLTGAYNQLGSGVFTHVAIWRNGPLLGRLAIDSISGNTVTALNEYGFVIDWQVGDPVMLDNGVNSIIQSISGNQLALVDNPAGATGIVCTRGELIIARAVIPGFLQSDVNTPINYRYFANGI